LLAVAESADRADEAGRQVLVGTDAVRTSAGAMQAEIDGFLQRLSSHRDAA
jgi:hypothetical protein